MTFQDWLKTENGRMVTFDKDFRHMLETVWNASAEARADTYAETIETLVNEKAKLEAERDELARQLEQARQVCAYWLNDARFIVANTTEHNAAVEMLKRVVNDTH